VKRRALLAGGIAAGAAFALPALRGSRAAAQSGTTSRMHKWAYSTEGFERIVHRIDGVETVTYAIGPKDADASPLVYFHGGGTFHGFEWVRPLADTFRVYCPQHPNFGESGDADFTSMADYVSHYEMLFAGLGLEDISLCGASMGGHLAARYAAANPDEIDRLALSSPAGLVSDKAAIPNFAGLSQADIGKMFVSDPQWVEPYWPAEPSPEWQALRDRESAAAFKSREDPVAADATLRAGLKDFDRPTLLLWGEKDRIVPLPIAEEWQKVLPKAELAVIPGGSHLLLDEFPPAVAALRSFLEEG
jgi:pimeloyl-ACP methyl ester carboxylesterase